MTGEPEYSLCEMLLNMSDYLLKELPADILTNCTAEINLPEDLRWQDDRLVVVVAYTIIFLMSAVGNLVVFITLFRNRRHATRTNSLILHLAVADLLVTFIVIPMEVVWETTVRWLAGDASCRILSFARTFGLYLSSFILITISLDRYFAIVHPMSLSSARSRGKIMLVFSYVFSICFSIPQTVVFHVDSHEIFRWYEQCITFNSFPSEEYEMVYNIFCMMGMYGLPLLVIIVVYARIFLEIHRKSRESKGSGTANDHLRRSGVGNIDRARNKTLKMSAIIVLVFVCCWTPYFVMSMWYWFDRADAKRVDKYIQNLLFVFATSNSCMDPIVYGAFTIKKRDLLLCLPWTRRQAREMERREMSYVLTQRTTGAATDKMSPATSEYRLPSPSSAAPPTVKQSNALENSASVKSTRTSVKAEINGSKSHKKVDIPQISITSPPNEEIELLDMNC